MRVAGKVALISGGAGGIGAATAKLLASEGASVVIADLLEDEGRATEALIAESGGKALFVNLDVTSEESWKNAVQAAVSSFGKLDILVNNAGVSHRAGVEETSSEAWDKVMDVNVKGVFLGTKAAIPEMRKAGGGSIINISSHAATNIFSSTLSADSEEIALIGQNYGAAKVGLERLSWGLALELGPHNIAVNILKPLRPVITEGFLAQRPDADTSTWATPADMVKAAKYLAGQDAKGLTGATVTAEELVRRLGL